MDCVSCVSGQTVYLDALGSTHRSYLVDAQRETRRESGLRSFFVQTHFLRCQMASRVAVLAGTASANIHFEFPKTCSTVSDSH